MSATHQLDHLNGNYTLVPTSHQMPRLRAQNLQLRLRNVCVRCATPATPRQGLRGEGMKRPLTSTANGVNVDLLNRMGCDITQEQENQALATVAKHAQNTDERDLFAAMLGLDEVTTQPARPDGLVAARERSTK